MLFENSPFKVPDQSYETCQGYDREHFFDKYGIQFPENGVIKPYLHDTTDDVNDIVNDFYHKHSEPDMFMYGKRSGSDTFTYDKNSKPNKFMYEDDTDVEDDYFIGTHQESTQNQDWLDAEYCKAEIRKNPLSLKHVLIQSDDLCSLALDLNINAFEHVLNKTIAMCLDVLNKNGLLLRHIPHDKQTYVMCMVAIINNPLAIEFSSPTLLTLPMCLQAVTIDGSCLPFIPENLQKKIIIETAIENGFKIRNHQKPSETKNQQPFRKRIIGNHLMGVKEDSDRKNWFETDKTYNFSQYMQNRSSDTKRFNSSNIPHMASEPPKPELNPYKLACLESPTIDLSLDANISNRMNHQFKQMIDNTQPMDFRSIQHGYIGSFDPRPDVNASLKEMSIDHRFTTRCGDYSDKPYVSVSEQERTNFNQRWELLNAHLKQNLTNSDPFRNGKPLPPHIEPVDTGKILELCTTEIDVLNFIERFRTPQTITYNEKFGVNISAHTKSESSQSVELPESIFYDNTQITFSAHIKPELLSEKVLLAIIRKNPSEFTSIPKDKRSGQEGECPCNLTNAICETYFLTNHNNYPNIPLNFVTENMTIQYIKSNIPTSISNVDPSCLTENVIIELIKLDVSIFNSISPANLTENICLTALRINPMLLKDIMVQTDKMCEMAVTVNPLSLQFVQNQTDQVCKIATKLNPFCIRFVTDKSRFIEIPDNKNGVVYVLKSDINDLTEYVERYPHAIKYIDNPSEQMVIRAVKRDPTVYFHLKVLTPAIVEAVVNRSASIFEHIPVQFQTELLSITAIKKNIKMFAYVHKKTYDACKEALKIDPLLLKCINLSTDEFSHLTKDEYNELVVIAVSKNGLALEFVDDQSEELCKIAVRQNGLALRFVKNKTQDICSLAVSENSLALEFVDPEMQTHSMCFNAVSKTPTALKFVDNQTEDICMEALRRKPFTLEFVKNQTEKLVLYAVKINGMALRHSKIFTEKVCSAARKNKAGSVAYIKNKKGV